MWAEQYELTCVVADLSRTWRRGLAVQDMDDGDIAGRHFGSWSGILQSPPKNSQDHWAADACSRWPLQYVVNPELM